MSLLAVEKAWAARASSGPVFAAPTFVGDKLMLGAQTEIATAGQQSDFAEARMELLLSAFTCARVPERSLCHLKRALDKREEGEVLRAETHLALSGFWPSREPIAAARRAFVCDGLLRDGATPLQILAAVGITPPSVTKFNPNVDDEPRNPKHTEGGGQWTRGGSTAASEPSTSSRTGATTEAPVSEGSWSFSERLSETTVRALLRFFTRSNLAFIAFDTLFVPDSDHSSVVEGDVQRRPDLQYKWDKSTSQVFFRAFINGRWVTLTVGVENPLDQTFHDKDGKLIARIVGDAGLIADLSALDCARKTLAGSHPSTGDSPDEHARPKLCPETSDEDSSSWSENSRAYQEHVTGLERGAAILLNDVSFDGCDPESGDMREAKGNYQQFVNSDGTWKKGLGDKSYKTIRTQMGNQSGAAALDGRDVQWHVQQKAVADVLRKWVGELKLTNLSVIYDPWP